MKIQLLLLAFCFLSCNQSKKDSANVTTNEPVTNTNPGATLPRSENGMGANANSTPYAIMTDPAFLGEWVQQYSVADANNNSVLDEEERSGKDLHLGFDYFRFNEDLTCLRDHDMKFRGTYEISNASGKNKLIIRNEPPGEKYTYTLSAYNAKELILLTDAVFLVFKRNN